MRLERTIHRRGGSKGAWSREGRPSCPHKQLRKEGDGAMLKMDNQQGPTVQHRELCSMLCGSRAGRGTWGEWMHVCLWLSPFTVCLELSQHCSSAIPHYKITSSKEKKKKKRCSLSCLQGNSCLTQECSKDPYVSSSKLSELLSMVSRCHGGWCPN